MAKKNSRIILLTGATHGLGRALVAPFLDAGHVVWGCGRSKEKIQELKDAFGSPHDFSVLDVTDDAAVKAWAERLLKDSGPPDLVINNAAMINRSAPLWTLSADEFDPVIDVNIKGVVNVIRHVVPAMVERQKGVIVNLSSGWGRSVSPEVAPYCATKWAIEGLTKALAEELPSGMAAVPLNPGVINTRMLRSCFGESASSYIGPEEWADRAAPLMLSLSAKDNGTSLSV